MLKVGITGNLFSGIDHVCEEFQKRGIKIFDADIALKFILNYREDVTRNIRIQLGESVFSHGALDPNKFNTTEKFDRLLDLAQYDLMKCYETWRLKNREHSYTLFKSNILFERKFDKSMNFIINVFKPRDIRAHDMMESTGMSLIEIDNLFSTELNELTKNQDSTYIIHNYEDSFLSMEDQVKSTDDRIKMKINSSNIERINLKNMLL